MATIKASFNDKQLRKNVKDFNGEMNRRIAVLMNYEAAYTVGWLKQNAPWTDRTSAARTGLTALSFSAGNVHEIFMAYSVYYGIWLEVANSGRYAVIGPAQRIVGSKVMGDLQMLINAMSRS